MADEKHYNKAYLMCVSKMESHLNTMARILTDCHKAREMDETACRRLVRAIEMFNDASAALARSIGANFLDLCDCSVTEKYGVKLDEALWGGGDGGGDVHTG